MLDSLRESLIGKEQRLPVCTLATRKAPFVSIAYGDQRPSLPRLSFANHRRPRFEMILTDPAENLRQLVTAAGQPGQPWPTDPIDQQQAVFGVWARLALRCAGGKLLSARELFTGPSAKLDIPGLSVNSTYHYRIARLRKGTTETAILVSARLSRQDGAGRKGSGSDYNWLKLHRDDLTLLADHINTVLNSSEFAAIPKPSPAH